MKVVLDGYKCSKYFADTAKQTLEICGDYQLEFSCVLRAQHYELSDYKWMNRILVRNSIIRVRKELMKHVGADTLIITADPIMLSYCGNAGYPIMDYRLLDLQERYDLPGMWAKNVIRLDLYRGELCRLLDSFGIKRVKITAPKKPVQKMEQEDVRYAVDSAFRRRYW
jgi:hypothetical protein